MELCRVMLSRPNTAIAPFFVPNTPQTHHQKHNCKRYQVVWASSSSNGRGSKQLPKEGQISVSITGATGFIGRRLVQKLLADDHRVHVLTRSRSKAQLVFPVEKFPKITVAEEGDWRNCIECSDAVVNLAGMPISTRWSPEIKKEIKQSRIRVTSKVFL